uniref:Ribosomal protein L5 n=1 Tax=Mesostigma viride TaxID=41882 RepID=Q8W9S9_MESVI|nr:ribosomal protein L5 [Mesostigma viride]AAL36730.1 ribosomal protein L5 [Mesostigma viride]
MYTFLYASLDTAFKQNSKNIERNSSLEKLIIRFPFNTMKSERDFLLHWTALGIISGQKPKIVFSTTADAKEKIKKGDPLFCFVTLRNSKMIEFLNKFYHAVFPILNMEKNSFRFFKEETKQFFGYSFFWEQGLLFPELEDRFELFKSSFEFQLFVKAEKKNNSDIFLTALNIPLL